MTAVAFHFNVPDRRDYACRLLRKALRAQAGVVVTGDEHVLDDLNRQLWIFEPLEFLPHWRGARAAALPARLAATPLLLLDQPSAERGQTVLVNLGRQVPEGYGTFERLIEIVGLDEADRLSARDRWRRYQGDGRSIERHEVRS
ncbi:MAG TPA: DNA polymerase III subunit chi [Burkholderiaceae bacterium]|nr:DNA polymerase III subunit chi [Burkholderiaceae bacterium]HNB43047.1 DNA polymerase III subunit chi [Burkholderiaceae bacterium]HNG78497.1 DNA polymerase III subunit chi [Burkholderiaceae bacterium]